METYFVFWLIAYLQRSPKVLWTKVEVTHTHALMTTHNNGPKPCGELLREASVNRRHETLFNKANIKFVCQEIWIYRNIKVTPKYYSLYIIEALPSFIKYIQIIYVTIWYDRWIHCRKSYTTNETPFCVEEQICHML